MKPDVLQAFDHALRLSRDNWLHALQEEGFRRQDERIRDREKKDTEQRLDSADVMTIAVLAGATEAEVARLGERLELHQNAVIEALQENRKRLDASQERIDEMLGDAHVLPDGRRVFKSEDGVRVFDEHGTEVSPDQIDASEIEDWRPHYEAYADERETYRDLEEEQRALIDYQERLDDAEELIRRGNLTEDDLADIEDLLKDDVPDAVRRRLPAEEPGAIAAAETSPKPAPDSDPLDIGGLLSPSTMKLQ